MSRYLVSLLLLVVGILVWSLPPMFASAVTSTVANDGALGTTGISTAGGQKIIEDSFGKHLAVYIDSSGRLGVAFANGDPTQPGAWTVGKSQTPVSAYARPASVLVSPTSLRIIVEGGPSAGQLVDVPVSISRDVNGNILGVAFGAGTVLDNSGFALYPAAILAHDGSIILVWNVRQSGVVSKVNSLRWTSLNGWTSVANPTSTAPDAVITDTSDTYEMIVSVVERQDNFKLYVIGDRAQSSPETKLVFNSATYNGQSWAWGTQNLAYETNASRGLTDATSVAWDPVRSLVVVAYDITNTNAYAVFTLDSSDRKVHLDTPIINLRDNDWGTIVVDQYSGNYYLFMMDAQFDEGGPGKVEFIVHTTAWNATQTVIDSDDTNLGINVERTTDQGIDIVYSKGTAAPTSIRFSRIQPNFSLTTNPTSLNVQAGSSGSSTITVASIYGFTGTVALSFTMNSTGLSCTLFPTSIAGGSGASTLSCSSSVAGNYLATVTGTSGTISHATTVTLHVQDYSIIASPTSATILAGATGTSIITVAPLNSFTGTVTLAVTTNSTNLSCSLSATSIPSGSGTSTLSCSASIAGNYLATVTGTNGALSHSATVTYNVQDFTVTASTTSITVNAGVAGTSTITVVPLNGFAGTVTLAVTTNSTNLSCTLSATSITGGSGTSTPSCTGSVAGNYLATVTGTNAALSHSATVTFHVQDYTVTASPTSVNVNAGAIASSTITVAPLNGFAGTVTLAVTTNSTNLVCVLSVTTITGGSGTSSLSCHGTPAGNYLATVTGTSGTLSHSATVTFHVQDFTVTASTTSITVNASVAGTSTITVAPLNGFAGTVTLAVTTNSTNLSCTLSSTSIVGGSGTSTLSCSASIAGNYLSTVTGTSGALSHSAAVTYHVQDFTVIASVTSVTVNAGLAGTSTITVAPVNGFTGTVTLAVTTNSTNLSCTLSSSSTTGGSGASTLSCSSTIAATYLATVTGSNGTLSHTSSVTYRIQDYTVTGSPTSLTANVGITSTSTITVATLNGFSGTVTLATTTNSTSLTCSLGLGSIVGGSGASTLSCSSNIAGNYLAIVTGTSGTLSHAIIVTYNVQDYTVVANPSSVTVNAGATGTSTITITAQNGFAGVVSLTTNSTSCSVSPTSVTGPGSATLSCTFGTVSTVHLGVTGTSGSLSRSVTVTYVVQDFTNAASPASVNVNVNAAGTSTITITGQNGFAGLVNVATNTTESCGVSPTGVTGSGTSTLSCTFTATGTFHVGVTGTSSSLSHSVTVTFVVQDFTITASPTIVTVNVNAAGTSSITIAAVNGFAGVVNLTTNSTSCSVSLTSVTGSGSATLSCTFTIASAVRVGVTGTSGSLSHSVTVTYQVQDFTIAASPTSVTVNAGSAGTSTITVSAVNGFAGVVSITTNSTSCSVLPAGVTGSGSSTLSCTFTTPNTFHVGIIGTGGSLSHSVTVTYMIQDFTIAASPASVTVLANSAGTSTITITGQNGFGGVVNLATNTTASCTVSPTSASGSGSSTLSCTFTSAGTVYVGVTGTSGSLSHSVTMTYTVQDFTIVASPLSVSYIPSTVATSTITITSQNGFAGVVSLATNTTAPCTVSPPSVTGSGSATLSCTFTTGGVFHVGVTGTSGSLSHGVTVTYTAIPDFAIVASPTTVTVNAGSAGTSTITITPLNGFTGTVNLSSNSTSCSVSPQSVTGSGSATSSCTFAAFGTFQISVTGSSDSISHSVTVTLIVQDFSIAATPTNVTVNAGSAGTSTAAITAQNSFGGVVTLTTNSTSCTLSPGSVAGSGRSILSCTFTAAINVSVIVTGTTGSLSHAALVTYVVEDFAITGAADPLVSPVGANATSSVTLRSLNGYSGTVNITATVLCSSCPSEGFGGAGGGSRPLEMAPIQDSPSTSFNPVSIGLSSGGTGQSILTITLSTSVQAGNYTITVTASDGTISHSVALMLIATDFRLSALTTILFVAAGNNSTQTLTLLSLNGFQGSMLLSSTTSPSGPLASLNPSSIYLTSYNGTVLAITVPSNTTSGNYVVTVTAVSGSTIHMITITVTVYSGFTNVLARMLASGGIATTLVVGLLTLVSLFPLYATGILARPDRRDRQTSVHRIRTAPSPKRAPIASSLIMTGLFWTLTRDY